jgi:hypothetical protein
MLFCKPGTTIVEMFPNENRPLMYYRIAMLCQHNYYPVLGKLRDKSKLNWIIDIEKLKKIIKTLV